MSADAWSNDAWVLRDGVPYAVFVHDLVRGQTKFLNRRFEALLGHACSGFSEDPLKALVHPEDLTEHETTWARLLDAKEDWLETEERLLHADGSWRWIWTRFEVLDRGGDGRASRLLGTALDVTRRRARERKQTESQKLDVVSRLSGSVAHEFNNFLTVILGNVALALERPLDEVSLRQLLEEVAEVAQHAAIVTRQLLSFTHNEVVQPEPVAPNEILQSIRRILRRLLPEKVELKVDCDPSLGRVLLDRAQLALVLLALVTNARDAIGDGGLVAVRTARRPLPPEVADLLGGGGRGCLVLVSDTGGGMDAGTVSQIFEPFFSTKADQRSGLGLTTVRAIVNAAGGHVRVRSEKGRGTEVEVWFREVPDSSAGDGVVSSVAKSPTTGGKVLLVEDDPLVAKVARNLLASAGYEVLRAGDGEAALALYDAHAAEIGLVLSDVMMPKLSGVQMAVRLRERRPSLPIVLMSGYTQDELERPHGLGEIVFVPKPFTATGLLEAVAKAWAT